MRKNHEKPITTGQGNEARGTQPELDGADAGGTEAQTRAAFHEAHELFDRVGLANPIGYAFNFALTMAGARPAMLLERVATEEGEEGPAVSDIVRLAEAHRCVVHPLQGEVIIHAVDSPMADACARLEPIPDVIELGVCLGYPSPGLDGNAAVTFEAHEPGDEGQAVEIFSCIVVDTPELRRGIDDMGVVFDAALRAACYPWRVRVAWIETLTAEVAREIMQTIVDPDDALTDDRFWHLRRVLSRNGLTLTSYLLDTFCDADRLGEPGFRAMLATMFAWGCLVEQRHLYEKPPLSDAEVEQRVVWEIGMLCCVEVPSPLAGPLTVASSGAGD